MFLQVVSILTMALLVVAVIKIIHSFMFRKKLSVINPDYLSSEIAKHQKMKHQILLIFENGYWEIKEEEHSKEWSMGGGTQNFVDLDTDIDNKRFKQFMGEPLKRDKEGHHDLRIIKEIELKESTHIDEILKLKI